MTISIWMVVRFLLLVGFFLAVSGMVSRFVHFIHTGEHGSVVRYAIVAAILLALWSELVLRGYTN